ncbi:phage portal protein [Mycolicibacterium fluoranthenivorans]|nr:phage portal protein [Mycolicibacterium fluoranthenivorans]
MFTSVTRPPWQDKMRRPASEGSGAFFTRYTTPRNRFLDMLWSYNVGDPPLPQIEEAYRDVFRHVMRKARSNYAPMCLSAMSDRMELQAISTLADDDTNGDDIAAQIMDETGFVAQFKELQDFAFSMGESYGMAVPKGGGVALKNGQPCPSVHAIDPRRCIGIPDLTNPTRLRAAVVKQYDPITDEQTAFLFLPGRKYTYRHGSGGWTFDADVEVEAITGLDELGGIPIVRFDNLHGMGEYEPHIDLLDRINDTTLQRIIGFWYQALRQRGLFGDDDEDDEDDDDDLDGSEGRRIDPENDLKAGPGALWRFPADFKMWESAQTDLGQFINAKRDDVKEFAAVTSTPLHLITPDAANGSAEGAGLMRESLTSKVRDRRTRFTPQLKLLWRMAFAMAGETDRGTGMRLNWGPIEFRTLAEQASASSQAVGTLSLEDRCERIWQMSPEETDRNVDRMTADALLGLPTTPGQTAPAQTPPAEQQPSSGPAVDNTN